MRELLVELFSEEIPATMQKNAVSALKELVESQLKIAGINYSKLNTYIGPRRLTLVINGLPLNLSDKIIRKKGPQINCNEQALNGFLKSCNLEKQDLQKENINGQEYFIAVIEEKAGSLEDFLICMLKEILTNFPWPKTMRWGTSLIRWIRPLRNILAILDNKILPFSFGELNSNNYTYGHRFMANNNKIEVKDFANYQKLLKENYVILDQEERKNLISNQINELFINTEYEIIPNEGLLDEVTGLVEYPVALLGNINEKFLKLPVEVLSTSMRNHQRYFSIKNKQQKLAAKFITIANIAPEDKGLAIIAGNEKVLRARLTDGEFYWNQDLKVSFEQKFIKLERLVFHAKLGTVKDKIERMLMLGNYLADEVKYQNKAYLERAIKLCKTDLVTEMVGEFPELQGIIGKYYAQETHEPQEISQALEEHYWPKSANDQASTNMLSSIVGLADKIDSLVGLFIVGEKPTGSKDPFALRRSAIGIIKIILANKFNISFKNILEKSIEIYSKQQLKIDINLLNELWEFIIDRYKNLLKNNDIKHDLITSVLASNDDNFISLNAKIYALEKFLKEDKDKNIQAYIRAANISNIEAKKDKINYDENYDQSLFKTIEEEQLSAQLNQYSEKIRDNIKNHEIGKALDYISILAPYVNNFFDKVTINVEEKDLRINRLKLLVFIKNLFSNLANFAHLEL